MHEIDGEAGGGQIVRTAVALSALTGEGVRVENVRGDRDTPGMRPQHRAAVEATAALCDADVEGADEGSETLTFDPGPVAADDVSVDVGTAGSVALVLDAVLPLATALDEPASVTVLGGTDVEWAPPIAYHRQVKLPLLRDVGLEATLEVGARGFYPVGGGEATLSLSPSTTSALAFVERGPLRRLEVHSTADESLSAADVAERQAAAAARQADTGAAFDVDVPVGTVAAYDDAASAGSSVTLVAVYEHTRAGFTALGEAGKPSEDVAAEAVAGFQRFHGGGAAVDRHMADQLTVFQAVAGGEVLVPELTAHLETNLAVVEAFGFEFDLSERDDGVLVSRSASR